MSAETWIIVGATSGMAIPFTRLLAGRGAALVLAGRRMEDLSAMATDLTERGAVSATPVMFDARDPGTFDAILAAAKAAEGTLNAAVFVGSMPEQSAIDADPALVDGTIADSLTGPARLLTLLAPQFEDRGTGTIIGIGSVAGDRGRIGNYVYGAAKAGFATYLSGLRNRLGRSGVHVLTVKPGPVRTPMTQGMKMPFMAEADATAEDILKAADRKKNVLYTKRIWWPIMSVIRAIPEPIFKKMSV